MHFLRLQLEEQGFPEKEKKRAPDQDAELLTPISGQRKEEDTILSSLHTLHVCDLPMKSGGGTKCIDIGYHGREQWNAEVWKIIHK